MIFGNVNNSQIQNLSPDAKQDYVFKGDALHGQVAELTELIKKQIDANAIPAQYIDQIKKQVDLIITELSTAKSKKGILHKSFSIVKDLLLNVGGNLIASGLIYEIGKLLPALI